MNSDNSTGSADNYPFQQYCPARRRPVTINFLCLLLLIVPILLLPSCDSILPSAPASEDVLAEPVEDLSPEQLALHISGDIEFARVFGAADGLGPVFVAASCESCHVGDGKGHPLTTLTRFGRLADGVWDPMPDFGGPQLQQRAIDGFAPEMIPAHATGVTRLMPPAVTGLGYLELVPDETLLALADPDDADGDGISGVAQYVDPPDYFQPQPGSIPIDGRYIGRFGKKAGAIDLLQQVVNAYKNDMGITSDFEIDDLFNPQAGGNTVDEVADPEVPASTVHSVVFYIRTLKVPPRRDADNPEVLAGEEVFKRINCSGCHTPVLQTGPSDIEALANVEIYPFTDLLLHDMGAELNDAYIDVGEEPGEWRTPPLWGLGLAADSQGGRMFLMHDGRAATLTEAILLHGGEAAASRAAFQALSASEQNQLLRFLESL